MLEGSPMTDQAKAVDRLRREVRDVLARSAAWQSLPPARRDKLAGDLLEVTRFLSQPASAPASASGQSATAQGLTARALDATEDLKGRLASAPGLVGSEFEAGAMKQGVEGFGNLVQTVDFPEFVGGLIDGVFKAIVNASIQQMEAYGELLAATAKSVGQFAQDHVSDSQAREQLASRNPSLVRIENGRLVPREGAEDMSALTGMMGPDASLDFDDPESETQLVNAAKLEMARQRQKMMALMVMLGINRIVVTNGRINAKVVFDIETNDYAKRLASAGMVDDRTKESGTAGMIHTPWGGGGSYSKSLHKTTVRSSVDETSESKAQMKAQLTGEVRVNFKSETLPPERMLDALQFDQINYMSQGRPAPAPAPGTAGPPAPPGGAPSGTPAAPPAPSGGPQ
jgi:hypothetical protein